MRRCPALTLISPMFQNGTVQKQEANGGVLAWSISASFFVPARQIPTPGLVILGGSQLLQGVKTLIPRARYSCEPEF